MGILRTDQVTGLGGANAIKGSVKFVNGHALEIHPNSADFRLGSNDFTVEFWGNTIGTGNAIIFGLFENSPARRSYTFETRANRALRFECWSDGSSSLKSLTSSTGVWELSTWHYFTVVRNGTALNIYVDGVSVAGTNFDNASDSLYENTVEPLILGASKQGNVFYGNHGALYISNFRLTNGTALYTGNFTPPNRELTKLSTTNVLCCQSSGDVLKEETGKILVTSTNGGTSNGGNGAPPQASHFTPHSPVGFSTIATDQGTNSGTTFNGVTTFDSQAYFVPPGSITRERYPKSSGDIVSGNLIFHLDGGDSKSYAGVTTSGDIIYDLKEGTNSTGVGIATMASGHSDFERVTWVPDNRGCFRQSSDSDFGTVTGNMINFPQIQLGNDNYTINVWVKLNSLADGGDEIMHVISNKDSGPVSFGGHLRMNNGFARIGAQAFYSTWTYRYSTTTAIGPGKWYLLTWVNTAQYTGKMYVDGVLQTLDDGNTTWNSRTSNNTPLNSTSYATKETFDGWIGQIQFYSDTLSEAEILQNYNAHKCRYVY